MSDRNSINRRKALKKTGGIGGALIGIPVAVAGESDESDEFTQEDIEQLSEEEIKQLEKEIKRELAQMSLVVGGDSDNQYESDVKGERDIDRSDTPEELNIFVGENSNAETPTGQPYAVETKEEWLEREAPPGFDAAGYKHHSESIQPQLVPDLYVQEDLGSVGVAGYSVELGIGFGIIFRTGPIPGATASVSLDIYVNSFTVTLFEFSVEVGVTEEGLCFNKVTFSPPKLPGKASGASCFDFGVQTTGGGDISVFASGSVEFCLNPCSPLNCGACGSKGFGISYP